MKFELHDIVKVISGKYVDQQGSVVGSSITTRGGVPCIAEYQVQLKDINRTEEFQEDFLTYIGKAPPNEADVRRAALLERRRVMEERKKALELEIAELKEEENMKTMEEAIQKLEDQKNSLVASKESK